MVVAHNGVATSSSKSMVSNCVILCANFSSMYFMWTSLYPYFFFFLFFFICNVHKFCVFCVSQQCYCHITTLGELFVVSSTLLSSHWNSNTTTPKSFPQQHHRLFSFQKKLQILYFIFVFPFFLLFSLINFCLCVFFIPFLKIPKIDN